jgi:hypothetical protein
MIEGNEFDLEKTLYIKLCGGVASTRSLDLPTLADQFTYLISIFQAAKQPEFFSAIKNRYYKFNLYFLSNERAKSSTGKI